MISKAALILIVLVSFVSALVKSAMMQPNVISVAAGDDLQAALDRANCGDEVVLQDRAQFNSTGDGFRLAKPCLTNPITIRSATLPPNGRLKPAASLARLVGTAQGPPVLTVAPGAQGYRLIGLEITTNARGYTPDLINFGAYFTRDQRINTRGFVFDRVFAHTAEISADNLFPSTVERTSGRGMALGVADITVIHSYVAGFAGKYPSSNPNAGQNIDSYGIYADFSPGPLRLIDNYIEGQFNNVFIGGAGLPTTNTATIISATENSVTLSQTANLSVGDLFSMSRATCVPTSSNLYAKPWMVGKVTAIEGSEVLFSPVTAQFSCAPGIPDAGGIAKWNGDHIRDVEIRGNFLNKPDAWNAYSVPKGWIEIKECVDCVVDGNDMYSGVGSTNVITVRNQDGASPWATIEGLQFTNNRMSGYKWGFSLLFTDNEQPSANGGNVRIENNLFLRPLKEECCAANFLQLVGGHDVHVTHNTIVQPGNPVMTDGRPVRGFIFRDNITANYQYGMQCYLGLPETCWPNAQIVGNIIIDTRWDKGDGPLSNRYPVGNYFPELTGVGFAEGSLLLSPTSPYKGKATDGKDPGVDMAVLLAALGSSIPIPSPTATPTPTATATPVPSPSPSPTVAPTPVASPTPKPSKGCKVWPPNKWFSCL